MNKLPAMLWAEVYSWIMVSCFFFIGFSTSLPQQSLWIAAGTSYFGIIVACQSARSRISDLQKRVEALEQAKVPTD